MLQFCFLQALCNSKYIYEAKKRKFRLAEAAGTVPIALIDFRTLLCLLFWLLSSEQTKKKNRLLSTVICLFLPVIQEQLIIYFCSSVRNAKDTSQPSSLLSSPYSNTQWLFVCCQFVVKHTSAGLSLVIQFTAMYFFYFRNS